ncbi:gp53-like domain-containing protein [Escherichia albertii]|uniref:gp53-like domain-containing protein n=1 Tax=Escherichia albertii TaxID=208962 RepID=UPI003B637E0A
MIIQWGAGDAGTGYVGSTGNEMNFPIAFPSQCFQVVTSYDNGGGKIVGDQLQTVHRDKTFLQRL